MKIAEVSLYPPKATKHTQVSGVASYTKNLLKSMSIAADDELYILCEKLKSAGHKQAYKEDGFSIVRAFDRDHRFVGQLRKELEQLAPDVTHIQQEVPLYGGIHTAYLLQWLLFALRHKPTVITFHHVVNLDFVNKKFVRGQGSALPPALVKRAFLTIYKPLVRRAGAIIVHEQYFKDILISQYGAQADKVHVIPHGVENFVPLPMHDARQRLGVADDRKVVLFMGYLAGYKGFDLLLEGFAAYAKEHPEALLLIGAGEHPKFKNEAGYRKLYAGYQAKAAELIAADQYRWIGFIPEDETPIYYSASDVSLFPYTISMSSSGPMSFAIGYEKAFLASDVFAGVLPAETLFARTPGAVAAKLEEFFARPAPFAQLAKKMKQDRLWTKIAARTLQVYRSLAS